MSEEQRGDARDTKSVRVVTWQQTSAKTAEGDLVNMACVASARLTGRSWNREKTKLVGSVSGEKRSLQSVHFPGIARHAVWQHRETRCLRPHDKKCRNCIRVDTMCTAAGQKMLRAAEERLAPAAWAARVEVALEDHCLLGLSRDDEMTESCVTNIADNVKPRIAVDSIEVSSRM